MKIFKGFILLIFLLGGFGYLLYLTIHSITPAWIPFVTAGAGFLISRFYESWKDNKSRLYEKKREVYGKLLQPYINVLINSMDDDSGIKKITITPEIMAAALNAGFDAILYASDDVVKSYSKFRSTSNIRQISVEEMMVNLAVLLKAMRKDLGHQWTSLSDVEILSIFTNLNVEERKKITDFSKH